MLLRYAGVVYQPSSADDQDDFQTEWKVREDRASANLYIQGLPHTVTVEVRVGSGSDTTHELSTGPT